MATTEGVTTPAPAVFDAVVLMAKNERQNHSHNLRKSDEHARDAHFHKDAADLARARWEQCIDWLDATFPGWDEMMSEAQLKDIRG